MNHSKNVAALVAVWLVLVCGMYGIVVAYMSSAGESNSVTVDNSDSQSDSSVIVRIFLHPECPCSKTSLEELREIDFPSHIRIVAYFVVPEEYNDAWAMQDLWQLAGTVPSLERVLDHKGIITSKYAVKTSGHVIVEKTPKSIVFSGGITIGRGHRGNNQGKTAVDKLVHGYNSHVSQTPVFGCALFATKSL